MTPSAPTLEAQRSATGAATGAGPTRSIAQVFSLQVVTKVLTGVTGILLIRFMEARELARYTLALSAATLLTDALSGTFNRVYIVGHERLPVRSSPAPFLGFQLLSTAGLALLVLGLTDLEHGLWGWTLLLSVGITLAEFSKTAYQQELRFLRFSLIDCTRALLFGLSTVALALLGERHLPASTVLLLQSTTLLATFLAFFGARVDIVRLFALREVLAVAAHIARGPYRVLFVYFVLDSLHAKLDPFLIQVLAGPEAVATFAAAFRYYLLLSLALSSVQAVLLPLVQRARSEAELRRLVLGITRWLPLVAAGVLVAALLARWVLPWLDGGRYPESILVFQILALSSITQFWFSPHVNVVLRFEAFVHLTGMVVLALGVTVLADLALVPRWGATGAAVVYLVAHSLLNGMAFLRSRSLIRRLAPDAPDR